MDSASGKNNGTIKGRTYFEAEPKHGLMVREYDCEPIDGSVAAKTGRVVPGLFILEVNGTPTAGLAAMIVAQKVWDDKSLLNVDFSLICSAYSLSDINQLEKQFLTLLDFNGQVVADMIQEELKLGFFSPEDGWTMGMFKSGPLTFNTYYGTSR